VMRPPTRWRLSAWGLRTQGRGAPTSALWL